MRRIFSLIVVALVMAAMMLAMVMPAFAVSPWQDTDEPCDPPGPSTNGFIWIKDAKNPNADQTKCFKESGPSL
jgi:hypothetical protein